MLSKLCYTNNLPHYKQEYLVWPKFWDGWSKFPPLYMFTTEPLGINLWCIMQSHVTSPFWLYMPELHGFRHSPLQDLMFLLACLVDNILSFRCTSIVASLFIFVPYLLYFLFVHVPSSLSAFKQELLVTSFFWVVSTVAVENLLVKFLISGKVYKLLLWNL